MYVHVYTIHNFTALVQAQNGYEEKVGSVNTPRNVLLKLAWNVQELQELTASVRQLIVDISSLREKITDVQYDIVKENTARTLIALLERMVGFVKKLSKNQRTAATHIPTLQFFQGQCRLLEVLHERHSQQC